MEELEFVKESAKMAQDLFNIMGIDFEDSTEFDRQALSAFSFGMITTFAQENKIDNNIVFNTMGHILVNVFKYSENQMKDFIKLLINSTKREYSESFYILIHQGIEMYYEYKEEDYDKVFRRMMDTYLMFKRK